MKKKYFKFTLIQSFNNFELSDLKEGLKLLKKIDNFGSFEFFGCVDYSNDDGNYFLEFLAEIKYKKIEHLINNLCCFWFSWTFYKTYDQNAKKWSLKIEIIDKGEKK